MSSPVVSSSAGIFDRESARNSRLNGFNANAWLRSVSSDASALGIVADATMSRAQARCDFVLDPPKLSSPKVENFLTKQEYSGVVLSIDLDLKTFWARLADLTSGLPDEEAEFNFDEVPSDDWSLIVPGALFSWNIGCEWRDRQMRRVADFRFRRFIQFSKAAIARATKRADVLTSLIAELNAYPAGYTPEA